MPCHLSTVSFFFFQMTLIVKIFLFCRKLVITSVGLGVTFSVYFTRAYLVSDLPTPKERVMYAMTTHGTSVFNGALSTWLGILVLAFAQYQVFQIYFFRMYFAMILLGIFHAFIFVPVYLATVGEFIDYVKHSCSGKKAKMYNWLEWS